MSDYQGWDLVFDPTYFSNEKGTIQFSIWTGTNLYDKYEPVIEVLLNGLVVID